MSDAITLAQPRQTETSALAACRQCGRVLYQETLVERHGTPVERIVCGSFRQALDADGAPTGPVIPFCNCQE